ncbi:TIR domain-containing protein [Bacteroides faecichinchillae]|uniref:TIR domain-containing protein n=2 Tax=Bacteroides faecichinchillae TaxID=871325 RepID=A0A1M4TN81_9BACE|nr:TIR domain-containing protein [Bacteroides faecichinchillae]
MPNQEFKYYAFISYSWKDKKWAKWLQDKLEAYRLPSMVRKQNPDIPKRFDIFRDQTDIRMGPSLKDILHDELANSKYLVIVCSPHAARSKWVSNEISEFIAMGKKEQIILFIVDGIPYSGQPDTECYPDIIKQHFPEYLGADVHAEGNESTWSKREKAFIRMIASMLDLNFDSLWNRHRRYLLQKLVSYFFIFLCSISALCWTWYANRSFNTQMTIHETTLHNPNLPPLEEAQVILQLKNEIKQDTLHHINDNVLWTNIPAKYRNKPVSIRFVCSGFESIDTTIVLKESLRLPVKRDPAVYGNIIACLYDIETERVLPDIFVEIEGRKIQTDTNGYLHLFIPLAEQRKCYTLKSSVHLVDTCIYMPCDSNAIIRTLLKTQP